MFAFELHFNIVFTNPFAIISFKLANINCCHRDKVEKLILLFSECIVSASIQMTNIHAQYRLYTFMYRVYVSLDGISNVCMCYYYS